MKMWVLACRAALAVPLVLLVASGGCRKLAPKDVSLLTGEPCEPPCWQGLTAGVSTEDEVEKLIATSGLVDRTSIFRSSVSRGGRIVGVSIQWLSTANVQGRHATNSFNVEDGILQHVTIYLDAQVTLDELFGRYGPPDKYVAALSGIHFTTVRVRLFYPEHGFTARVELPRHDASLRADTKVSSVWYFRMAPLERFLQLGRDVGYFSASVQPQSLSDWEGYGPVEVE